MPRHDLRSGPRRGRPPRQRLVRRNGLLAAGLTGLVVTGTSPAFGEPVATATVEQAAIEQPDPAPLFGHGLRSVAAAVLDHAAPEALVSAVGPGRSAVARWDGVRIFTDGERTELVGFHESNNARALAMDSTRPIAASHHPSVSVPTTGEVDGQIVVLPTRYRGSGPMTAIDIAVHPTSAVTSPVDGVVVASDPIQYRGADHKIVIVPDGNRDVEVSILHVVDPLVVPGDRVRGGQTPVATSPRQLQFESQVDRFTSAARGTAAPHVHVEMRAAERAVA